MTLFLQMEPCLLKCINFKESHRMNLMRCILFSSSIYSKVSIRQYSSSYSSKSTDIKKNNNEVVKIPSIIFFGGDCVSLVALKALHERLKAITASNISSFSQEKNHEEFTKKFNSVKPQLVVVCPFLPDIPKMVYQRHRRQYPVARYCVENDIPLIPINHPTSLKKSETLQLLLHPWSSKTTNTNNNDNNSNNITQTWTNNYIAGQSLESFDVAVVVSFRYFLPNTLLERLPRTINLHPSLLPRYRGASPIFAPLLHNDIIGGASVIKLLPEQKLMDGGDVLWQKSINISNKMSIREYFPLVTKLGAEGLCECLFGAPPTLLSDHYSHITKEKGEEKKRVSLETIISSNNNNNTETDILKCNACDWPLTFNTKWAAAWPQGHNIYFKEDPYHAPLLSKDRSIIHWHKMTAEEAYGTWRAFVGGEYFNPTVNAILDKGATPVREQLLKRIIHRAAREIKKKLRHHLHLNNNNNNMETKIQTSEERKENLVQKFEGENMENLNNISTNSYNNCNINSNNTLSINKEVIDTTSKNNNNNNNNNHLHHHLLIACTFTDAIHPKEIPSSVLRELELLFNENNTVKALASNHHSKENQQEEQENFDSQQINKNIEPGSAYFPKVAEEMCAVKCYEGWFVWREATLKGSTSQPAHLLRKGMAMKTGVLYPALFVDNDGKEVNISMPGVV